MAIVITTDATGHGFVDGDNRGGAITTKMAELDELEAHGDFLIYNWPEKAFWLRLKTKSDSKFPPLIFEENFSLTKLTISLNRSALLSQVQEP
ncbi:hypothetical protein ULG90_15800 [Halopseudomonas pachastrellae]|nr:hypothetical protein ULG90_15800 [Halopseudomonas pachastrellae]